MAYNLVTLNDGVQRIFSRQYDWCLGAGLGNFNSYNCPGLHARDRDNVPTYKDWVMILGGRPDVQYTGVDTDGSGAYMHRSSCLRMNGTHKSDNDAWGRTLGKPAGINGKPLSECKALDEAFFISNGRLGVFTFAFDPWPFPAVSEYVLFYAYYNGDAQRWIFAYDYRYGNVPSGESMWNLSQGHMLLQPGVYGAMVSGHAANGYRAQVDEQDGRGWQDFMRTGFFNGDRRWRIYNSIFFVDSPVYFCFNWGDEGYFMNGNIQVHHIMQCCLFRFTPLGAWHL